MNNTNSNFDLSKKWIKHNISKQLINNPISPTTKTIYNTDIKNNVPSDIYSKSYNIGLKYKHIIKKMPFLYRLAMRMRYKLTQKMNQNKSLIVSENLLQDLKTTNGVEFILSLYRLLLKREPDERGLKTYLTLLIEGTSKEIIFDTFIRSKEYKRTNQSIRHSLLVSKTSFFIYKLKRIIKKSPLIWVYRIFTTPFAINKLNQEYGIYIMMNEIEKTTMRDKEKLLVDELFKINNELLKNVNSIKNVTEIQNKLENDILSTINKISEINTKQDNIKTDISKAYHGFEFLKYQLEKIRENSSQIEEINTSINFLRENFTSPSLITGLENVTVIHLDDFMIGVSSEEQLRGHMEPGLVKIFSEKIKRGMKVVDIGANMGIYSLLAARKMHGEGKVFSFEPTPRTYNILKNNVQMNGFLEQGIINLYSFALSDKEGFAQFAIYPDNCGHNTLFPKSLSDNIDNQEIIQVPTKTLDEVLKNEEKIDIIKLDAEGAEPYILRGMKKIIEKSPKIIIFMELSPEPILRSGVDLSSFLVEISETFDLEIRKIDDLNGEITLVSMSELLNCISMNLMLFRKDSEVSSL